MPLHSPPVSPIAPEASIVNLLLEFVKAAFTGQPRITPLGDQFFPKCAVLFGDAPVPKNADLPQISGVILQQPKRIAWHGIGNDSPWQRRVENPASGVSYGVTAQATIEETVHGLVRRTLQGTDIRWRADGSAWVEETQQGGTWVTQRTFDTTTGLRWVRDPDTQAYVEQTVPGFVEQRRFEIIDPVWDGTTQRACGPVRVQWFVRTVSAGEDTQEKDILCRTIADQLAQLFQQPAQTRALALKGLRHWTAGSVIPMSMPGVICRTLNTGCEADYLIPVERACE